MSLREGSLLFLLGAGASVDAGIKDAKAMTLDIENKIISDNDFKQYDELYNFLKSSIIYQRGLVGKFDDQIVTIEELLDILSEISQKHRNKLYPFIGGWNIHLLSVAGENFNFISTLNERIRSQLFEWISIRDYDKAKYFCHFSNLASEIGCALRIFTLNYDICVERALRKTDFRIELGFDEHRQWEGSRFDENENSDVNLYLYKLHGSIDWIRDTNNGNRLTLCDDPQPNAELIFGVTSKLSSIDPYLFYVHELRKFSLSEALRYILVIGYSFSDEYINGLIGQAVSRNELLRVLVVSPVTAGNGSTTNASVEKYRSRIASKLKISRERIIHENIDTKCFFEKNMSYSYFNEKLGAGDEDPF